MINGYIFIRGWEAFPELYSFKAVYIILYLFCTLSFLVGRFLERANLSRIGGVIVWAGALWMAMFVYLLLFLLSIDVLRLIDAIIPIFPRIITENHLQTDHILGIIVFTVSFVVVVAGFINARTPRIRTIDLTIPKDGHAFKSLNVVVVSDIHLGTIVCKKRIEHIVEKINSLHPELVLLPGDVVDEDLGPVINQNLGETLRVIKAKYGVYAITGNHEYIGGADAACKYLGEHGITMIRDSVVMIENSLYIVGREDLSMRQFGGKRRAQLEELMAKVDKRFPVILMDHQPVHLEQAVENGIDLQLSGHTHHGQLWPFNYLTKKIYEVSWGFKKKGNTNIYVSCGVGSWGPPVRTGNSPEIINFRLTFQS